MVRMAPAATRRTFSALAFLAPKPTSVHRQLRAVVLKRLITRRLGRHNDQDCLYQIGAVCSDGSIIGPHNSGGWVSTAHDIVRHTHFSDCFADASQEFHTRTPLANVMAVSGCPQNGRGFVSVICPDGYDTTNVTLIFGRPVGFSFGCSSGAGIRGRFGIVTEPPHSASTCPAGSVLSGGIFWFYSCVTGLQFYCGPAFSAPPPLPPPSPQPPPAESCPLPALPPTTGLPGSGLVQWYRARDACGVPANFLRDLSGAGSHGAVLSGSSGLTLATDAPGTYGVSSAAQGCPVGGGIPHLAGQKSSSLAFGGSLTANFSYCVVARFADATFVDTYYRLQPYRQAIVTSLNCSQGSESCYIFNHWTGAQANGQVGASFFGKNTGGARRGMQCSAWFRDHVMTECARPARSACVARVSCVCACVIKTRPRDNSLSLHTLCYLAEPGADPCAALPAARRPPECSCS